MTICIDFDGTIVEHAYPNIGTPVPFALETIRLLQQRGHAIILFTMRHGETLTAAVKYLADNGVTSLYGVNDNPNQKDWTHSRKVYGHLYIDDAALGCPLIIPDDGGRRPYADWWVIRGMLEAQGIIK